MKRKITCFCDNAFDVEVPEEIDLDSNSKYLEEILGGSFLSFKCPGCGKIHKPEFPLSVVWPSQKISFEVLPELERGEFYRRKKPSAEKSPFPRDTLIGYPEMSERLAVIRDGFNPAVVEAIKYYLHVKAEEQYPDDELEIYYFGGEQGSGEQGSLEFHIHGLRQNEVAVMKIPLSLYEKTMEDYKKHPKNDLFSSLRVHSYLSVKNTMRPEIFK